MKLTLVVEFSVKESCGAMSPETPFKTVEELRNYVSSQKEELMYSLEVNRSCYVSDKDLPTRKPEKHHSGRLCFFVSDKLIYPHDIKSSLHVPFYFGSVISDKELEPDTPVYIEKYDKHDAFVRPLTMQDRVVDRNLNQIWPMATGQIPVGLKKLLEQTTEKVK